jgi:hypothetical protein
MQQFELGFESKSYFLFHDFDPNELCMINGLLIGGRVSRDLSVMSYLPLTLTPQLFALA